MADVVWKKRRGTSQGQCDWLVRFYHTLSFGWANQRPSSLPPAANLVPLAPQSLYVIDITAVLTPRIRVAY